MASRHEIIDVIDAFLEDKITLEEAAEWASKEISRTTECEDPASALATFLAYNSPGEPFSRPLKEQLLMDKEVLVHGIPNLRKELGNTLDAYWLAFTPWQKIVICQIKITENGERILEVVEEAWDGTELFHEEIPLPLKEDDSPSLSWKDIQEKVDACESGKMTEEELLQWVLDQMQRKSGLRVYHDLLYTYWKFHRSDAWITFEYIKGVNKSTRTW